MVCSHRGGQKKSHKEFARVWQLSVTCQWDESHPLEKCCNSKSSGEGEGLPFLPYLSFSFNTSVSLSGYHAFCDFLFFTLSPQTHMNNSSYLADPRLHTYPSVLEIKDTPPYCLPFSKVFNFLPFQCHQFMFFFFFTQATKMNSMQAVVQMHNVNMLTCVSKFTKKRMWACCFPSL